MWLAFFAVETSQADQCPASFSSILTEEIYTHGKKYYSGKLNMSL